jgi:hypothetical protein
MTQKQHDKHLADRMPQQLTKASELDAAEPTPDGLGAWEGGQAALKGSNTWVSQKSHSQRTGDSKNAPGTDYASKITHRQDADFNEIHTDADGSYFLYNVKTDAWDIPTTPDSFPYYEPTPGTLFAYNYRTGAWDVPVTIMYEGDDPVISDTAPGLGDFEQADMETVTSEIAPA